MKTDVVLLLAVMLFAELGVSASPRRTHKLPDVFHRAGGKPKRAESCPLVTCEGKGGKCGTSKSPDVALDTCTWGNFCELNLLTLEGKCAPFLKKGAACSMLSMCDPVHLECRDGKCAEPGIGSSCLSAEDCPGPMTCSSSKCVAGSWAKAGQQCDDRSGPKCNFEDGYFCNSNDVCVKAHTKKAGDSCTHDMECPLASGCDFPEGKCQWPWFSKKMGEVCETMECVEGLVCNSTEMENGVCLEPGAVEEGKKCTSNADCGDTGICECNSNLGHFACFKLPVFTRKIFDEAIEMQKCMEESGFSGRAAMECSMDHIGLAKKIQPWIATCATPGDSSRTAVSLFWVPFLALAMRMMQ